MLDGKKLEYPPQEEGALAKVTLFMRNLPDLKTALKRVPQIRWVAQRGPKLCPRARGTCRYADHDDFRGPRTGIRPFSARIEMAAPRKEKTGPPVQEDEAYTHLHDDDLKPLLDALARLSRRPPQTLCLRGGRPRNAWIWPGTGPRSQIAKIIANGARVAPCLACNACLQIGANEFLDLSIHDGRISNTEDEENPGPIKALANMNRVRGEKPDIPASSREGKRGCHPYGLAREPRQCGKCPAESIGRAEQGYSFLFCLLPSANSFCPRWFLAPLSLHSLARSPSGKTDAL